MEETASQDFSNEQQPIEGEGQEQAQETPQQEAARLAAEEDMDKVVQVTIDGQPQQLTVRELARLTSLEKASQARFKEAAEREKKLMKMWEDMNEDPEKVLRKLNKNPDEWAESYLKKKIEEMQMSPEQREYKKQQEEFQRQKAEFEAQATARLREEIDTEMTNAFSAAKLPKSPFLAARMAGLIAQSIENAKKTGEQPLTYQEAANRVKIWYQNSFKETFSQMDPNGILDFLGPEAVQKVRAALVNQVSKGTVPTANSARPALKAQATQVKPKPTKKMTEREWREHVDSL